MTKRIIFFADVQGNITGLREVFKEVDKFENVTYIIGLGDYFGWGAGHNDIIELCNKKNVMLVRGGHEEILNIIEYDEEKVAIIQKQVPYDKAEEDRLIEERHGQKIIKGKRKKVSLPFTYLYDAIQ